MSEATFATCSPPSESTLPVREVREREREGHGAISRERRWLFLPRLKEHKSLSASCLLRVMRAGVSVSDSLHALHCLQAGGLSGRVKLPQLMFHFPVMAYMDGVITRIQDNQNQTKVIFRNKQAGKVCTSVGGEEDLAALLIRKQKSRIFSRRVKEISG